MNSDDAIKWSLKEIVCYNVESLNFQLPIHVFIHYYCVCDVIPNAIRRVSTSSAFGKRRVHQSDNENDDGNKTLNTKQKY